MLHGTLRERPAVRFVVLGNECTRICVHCQNAGMYHARERKATLIDEGVPWSECSGAIAKRSNVLV
jgi:hypothetical protein